MTSPVGPITIMTAILTNGLGHSTISGGIHRLFNQIQRKFVDLAYGKASNP